MRSAAAPRSENSPARLVRVGVFALLACAGVAFRVWVVASPLGLVDGDEAVVGLMARAFLRGDLVAFFWGQEYGGSQEALLVAALLSLGVPARWAMELVPAALHLIAAVLVWRIGVRSSQTVLGAPDDRMGRSARPERVGGGSVWWAVVAAGVFWAGSPAVVWGSTKERGFYGFTPVCGLAVLLLVVRPLSRRSAVALGLVAGLGWWASPQILYFVVPAGAWLAWSHRDRLGELVRHLVVALPAAVVGALPWLWANVETGLASLEAAPDRRLFGAPFDVFFRYGLPMVLGLREPITLGWEVPGGVVAYGALLVGLAVVLVARPLPLRPVLLSVAAYPLVFALLPTTYYYGEPRYLHFLWPMLALVAGWALARLPAIGQVVGVVAVLALTGNGLAGMVRLEGPPGEPFEDVSPEPVDTLVLALDTLEADAAFADYWLAYRLTFETDERIVATPLQVVRDPRIDEAVRRDEHPVYVEALRCDGLVQQALTAKGIGFSVTPVARGWEVVVPDEPVLPEELAVPLGC